MVTDNILGRARNMEEGMGSLFQPELIREMPYLTAGE
jgi:hypothetical protein